MAASATSIYSVDGTLEKNGTTGADGLDGDPNTLFDNNARHPNGTFSTIHYRNGELAWTVGANYDFTSEFGAFARYSRGNSFPFFDNLRDGLDQTRRSKPAGRFKASTDLFNLYLTAVPQRVRRPGATQVIRPVRRSRRSAARGRTVSRSKARSGRSRASDRRHAHLA